MNPNGTVRRRLVPAVLGVVAPHVLVGIWGMLVAAAWVPFWRWAWVAHGVKERELPIDPTPYFDSVIGLVIGAGFGFALWRTAGRPVWQAWALFTLAATLSMVADWSINWELVQFALAQPLVLAFIVGAALLSIFMAYSHRAVHAS